MVLLWQSSAFLLRLGFFPQHAGFGYLACAISSIAANPMNYYGHGSDIFGILESEYGISRAKATRCMRYSIAIAWQSQENKEFHALFKSYGDESASSFSVQRSKSDPRKYENQKRIIQYLPYLNPEIVIQSRIFRAAHRPDGKQDKRKCHGNRKQPDNDSFCGKASFCSTFLQRNRSAGHKTNA